MRLRPRRPRLRNASQPRLLSRAVGAVATRRHICKRRRTLRAVSRTSRGPVPRRTIADLPNRCRRRPGARTLRRCRPPGHGHPASSQTLWLEHSVSQHGRKRRPATITGPASTWRPLRPDAPPHRRPQGIDTKDRPQVHLIIRGALNDVVKRGMVNRNVALAAQTPKLRSMCVRWGTDAHHPAPQTRTPGQVSPRRG